LLLKVHLRLHLLWSAKPVVVQRQVWAALIVSQVLHAFQFEIAARAGARTHPALCSQAMN
jgi:hypothetical protein